MTTTDIDAIRQRAQAATPGPWHTWTVDPRPRFQVGTTTPFRPVAEVYERDERGNDAEFIAHARTDVPALLAKVDELTAEREHMELNPTGTAEWLKNRVNELTAELTEECREHSESKAYAKQIYAELTKVQDERNNACREVARLTAALAEKDAQLTAANRRADGLQPAERAKPNVARTGCDRCSVEPGERHRYAGCLGNVSAHESDCMCWDVQSESCVLPSEVAR